MSCNTIINKTQNKSLVPFAKIVKVVDANNEPMPNVYVSNLTTNIGTITNFDGIASIKGNLLDTIEINHISHDVEQFTYANLPSIVKLSKPHSLDEVTVIGEAKQAGVGIALAIAGIGLLLAFNPGNTSTKVGLNAPKKQPLKVTL